MSISQRGVVTMIVLAVARLLSAASAGDNESLWKIQQTLASKTYVDLTHEFQPSIPRWPGYPEETRKTIYWYEKRPRALTENRSTNEDKR
jgi:hypothetical protein